MNRKSPLSVSIVALALVTVAGVARAQAPPAGQKTLAATMEIYAFPQNGQPPEVQSTDEAQCYAWAVQTTGVDPFELQKHAQQQTAQIQGQAQQQAAATQQHAAAATAGAGAKGAVGGAAVGALIGGISGNAGEGAAIGAATGIVAGRSRARGAQQQAQAQATATTQQAQAQVQQVQAATAEQIQNFKKAFSVCLEAKHYLVKF